MSFTLDRIQGYIDWLEEGNPLDLEECLHYLYDYKSMTEHYEQVLADLVQGQKRYTALERHCRKLERECSEQTVTGRLERRPQIGRAM